MFSFVQPAARAGAVITVAAFALAGAPSLVSADTLIDFDEFAVGTIITNQYAAQGVTFSAVPGSCGGGNPDPVIVNPSGGTSSSPRGLSVQTGCPDFSPDYLRMVFSSSQERVQFTLGDFAGTYTIRAYTTSAGGAAFSSQTIVIEGVGAVGVHRLVSVNATALNKIRRVEVEEEISLFEVIDDLFFTKCTGDTTPPTSEISAPPINSCGCGTVSVTGVTCDPDGNYGNDRLEYQRVNPPGPWTLVGTFTSPVCAEGPLYSWSTAPAAITEGLYILRLTTTNACGLTNTDFTTVYVDKSFTGISVTSPPDGGTTCGIVEFVGTVDDYCFDNYSVDYQPAGGGAFLPVDPGHPVYSVRILNCTIATWNTVDLGLADGTYTIRIRGTDSCGNVGTVLRSITIDNTPPTPLGCAFCLADLDENGVVNGLDLAMLLGNWGPCP